MADKNRCYLCGQKLRRGVCTCCGLDNARMTRREYRLNETTPYHVKQRQIAAQKAENMQYAAEYRKKQQNRSVQQSRPAIQNRSAQQSRPAIQNRSIQQSRPVIQNRNVQEKKSKTSKWKGLKIFGILYALLALIPGIVSCVSNLYDELSFSTVYEYEEVPYEIEDEYQWVQRELSDTGEYYEQKLGPGYYYVGVHIPEGSYTVSRVQGSYGYMNVKDEQNSIYMSPSFAANDDNTYYHEVVEDVRLYEGACVDISGDIYLHFSTENAQMDTMWGMENPQDSESVILLYESEQEYVVGEDISPGIYDIFVEEEWADVYLTYDAYNYYWWLDADTNEARCNNIPLAEGMTILVEYGDVYFKPSEWIATDDYDSYFEEYFF